MRGAVACAAQCWASWLEHRRYSEEPGDTPTDREEPPYGAEELLSIPRRQRFSPGLVALKAVAGVETPTFSRSRIETEGVESQNAGAVRSMSKLCRSYVEVETHRSSIEVLCSSQFLSCDPQLWVCHGSSCWADHVCLKLERQSLDSKAHSPCLSEIRAPNSRQ